ncbi:hypothetical protein ruthe_02590 [Rubellimicrobium thermophilum DSM 16684]|uniref:Uncharacterized protein n=1 Tax=Rubellimicrobium thermophilum DSM 16684 TaxID=1123069 RepID=S9QW07_9RHOB|nr:hypothetical protein ruthe_02590 [Rubellimicrobium thermophilum DSM 16684]
MAANFSKMPALAAMTSPCSSGLWPSRIAPTRPPRLLHDQQTRRHVPGVQAPFPEAIVASRGDIGEVERRRSQPPHPRAFGHQPRQILQRRRQGVARAEGDAGSEQRLGQACARTHPDAAFVEPGPLTLLGPEGLVLDGIVDHPGHDLPFVLESDGNGPVRQAVKEIRRPVQRVDDPAPRGILAGRPAALLAEKAVGGACLGQHLAQGLFGLPVSAADEIARPLDRDLKLLDLGEILQKLAACLAGGPDHDIEIGAGHPGASCRVRGGL